MAKKKRRPPAMRGPAPKGGQGLLAQVQKMQEEMAQAQEALAEETLTVSAGGGAVTIVITGSQHVERVEVDPDLLDPEERDMLQDLLVAAFNQALDRAKELATERMGSVTAGIDVPGLGDLGI
jgi:DNA-binding YbaB/EbfC family protein